MTDTGPLSDIFCPDQTSVSLRQPKPFELRNNFKCLRFCEVVDHIYTKPVPNGGYESYIAAIL